jgi:hypothetical protein
MITKPKCDGYVSHNLFLARVRSRQISASFDSHQLAATSSSGAESEEKCRPTRLMFGCNGLLGWNDLIRPDDLVSIFTAFRVEEFQFVAGDLSERKDGRSFRRSIA